MERENTPQLINVRTPISGQSLCLPTEIIEEILSRLPVKSLLKFRCVSKPWRSLIGSKRFIDKHLDNSTRNASFAHHRIILNSLEPRCELKQCSLRSMLDDPISNQFRVCDSFNFGEESIGIVGCCNGIVCILYERQHFMLWNPSTRMVKKLPEIDPKIKYRRLSSHALGLDFSSIYGLEFDFLSSYGFGFDCLSGDYKVFVVLSLLVSAGYETMVKVYSLQTNSWKLIENMDVSPFVKEGKFASGKLHWNREVDLEHSEIASFDLGSEVCGVVELPCYGPYGGTFAESMEVIGGCLTVLCDYLIESQLDIWLMREYGVRESWEKVVTIPALTIREDFLYAFSALLALGSDGEVLLIHGSTLVIYYPHGDGYRQLHVKNFARFRDAQIYVESLVSLVPYVEQEASSAE